MSRIVHKSTEWIYRGLWKVLVDFFRVPREAPDLPAAPGETVLRFGPGEGWLRYLKAIFWIVLLVTDIGLTAGYIAICIACIVGGIWWLALLLFPIAAIIIVAPDIVAYVGIHLKYDTTWYVMSERSMRIRRGIWSIHETTITYENVQNVKVQQGPLQRYFGIANLIVETAGGGGSAPGGGKHAGGGGMHAGVIEGIDNAVELRDRILTRLRASKSAGLGDEDHARDEHDLGAPAAAAGMGFSPQHVAALREIREAIRALRAA
jgi:membrane protein YdbS with pleckstrin-like domain